MKSKLAAVLPLTWKLTIVNGIKDLKNFNLSIARARTKCFLLNDLDVDDPKYKRVMENKHEKIIKYLDKNYGKILRETCYHPDYKEAEIPRVIWTMWWQGEEESPEVIRRCLNSLKSNSGVDKVYIITKENIHQFIDIPKWILEKVKNKSLSITHFSDYLRICLLEKYGGIWADASLFCSRSFPKEWFEHLLFSRKSINSDVTYVSKYRWTVGLLGGIKGHFLFRYVKEIFESYLFREKEFIDYYLLDYLICMVYNKKIEIKKDMEQIPVNNTHWLFFQDKMNYTFQPHIFDSYSELLQDTYLYYISWKGKYLKYDIDGNITNYEHITNSLW